MCNLDKNNLNALYENLRDEALAVSANYSRRSQGLALFMNQGMTAWIEAWTNCTPADYLPDNAERATGTEPSLPGSLHTEITTLLANMTLSVWEGGRIYNE